MPDPRPSDRARAFEAARGRLFAVAYRMLGVVADAEDAVQEAALRWSARPPDAAPVADPEGFLVRTVTRLAIDRLRARAVRREAYPGPWLPEPLLGDAGAPGEPDDLPDPDAESPAARAELADSLALGLLVVLETLAPAERAAFVLREAFGYAHHDVALALGTTDANARQIATRARARLQAATPRFHATAEGRDRTVRAFFDAVRTGDVEALVGLLTDDAVALSDGGGVVRAASRPIVGANRVARFVAGSFRKSPRWSPGGRWAVEPVNGEPGLVVRVGAAVVSALAFDVVETPAGPRIRRVYAQVNPAKLPG